MQQSDPLSPGAQMAHMQSAISMYRTRKRTWKRSTLNPRNAVRMMHWIDRLIETWQPITIRAKDYGVGSVNTIYAKWLDAIRWVIEHPQDYSRDFYSAVCLIKSMTRIVRTLDAIEIHPITTDMPDPIRRVTVKEGGPAKVMAAAKQEVQQRIQETKTTSPWKEQFMEWLSHGDAETPLLITGILLTPDEMEFVRAIARDNGWPHEVQPTKIKVIKQSINKA